MTPTQPQRQVTVTGRQYNQALQDMVPVPAYIVLAITLFPILGFFLRVYRTELTPENAMDYAVQGIVLGAVIIVVNVVLLILNLGARRRLNRLYRPNTTIGISEEPDALHLFTKNGVVSFPYATTKGRLTRQALRLTPAGGKRVAIARSLLSAATVNRFA